MKKFNISFFFIFGRYLYHQMNKQSGVVLKKSYLKVHKLKVFKSHLLQDYMQFIMGT